MSLCKYKHVFGKEGEGVHSIRLFNLAIMDVLFTVIAGVLIVIWWGWNWMRFLFVLALLFVVGVLMHRLFCVNTTINKMIFGVV
jgi:hypothetical protein